jgi:hypothetical protein
MMKKICFPISAICFILLLLLSETACFHRQVKYVERPAPPPTDEIYTNQNSYEQASNDRVSYQEFYDELSPYGSWIDYPTYGYVWIPRVSVDFHPYATHGHWVMTNYGWTWISDFHWGWAAFHYGRWAYEPIYGWLWVPGHEWSPAWVDWRESADYFGWAPLGPFMNVSINISCPFDHYRFIPRRHFTDRHLYNYYVDRHQNTTIINHTTVINETHVVNKRPYYYGPRKELVEKAVGQKINAAEVYDNPKPNADVVETDRVKVYRPRMDNVPTNAPKPAPKRVTPTTDLPRIPSDKQLSPSVRRENTEGRDLRPQDKQPRREDVPQDKPDVKPQPIPRYEPRPEDKQPRRQDRPQEKPDVKPQPVPRYEPRPEDKQPRRQERPQDKPDVKPQPVPRYEPRREDRPQEKPSKQQPRTEQPRQEKANPPSNKETIPPKKKNGENNN